MQPFTRDELLAFLNEMLEAERAGAKALLHIGKESQDAAASALAMAVHHDEAKWCAMLIAAIRLHGGTASDATGAFYEKVLAITEPKARLAFVNRGQGWVVRKLRELAPRVEDAPLRATLQAMLDAHVVNIDAANRALERA